MKTENLQKKFIYLMLVTLFAFAMSSCGIIKSALEGVSGLVGANETATVIAKAKSVTNIK